jgi:Na+/H+-dicarboxylate symporter
MEDNNKKGKPSRRNFLETGVTAAAGVALGLAAGNLLKPAQGDAPEMVKMLTADGKLVEVDKRLIPQMCGKPVAVSNQELLEWMKKGKS